MVEARSRDAWSHTSSLLWIVAESKRDRKKRSRAFTPAEFNPWERKGGSTGAGKKLTVGLLLALRPLFERPGVAS